MKRLSPLLVIGLAGCMAVEEPVALSPDDEGRLAAALGERVPGPPQNCVSLRRLRGNNSIGNDLILFNAPNGRIYVNRPSGSCPSLDFGRAIRTRGISTQLCENDIVFVFDPITGIEYGGCALGQFVPYDRRR